MIRAAAGKSVSRFVIEAFLELMTHFCFTKVFSPCDDAECDITDTEWEAIPRPFINKAIGGDAEPFDDVGGEVFDRVMICPKELLVETTLVKAMQEVYGE